MFKKNIYSLLVLFLTFSFAGCADDDPVNVPPFAKISISVKSYADSAVVAGANVVLYNAANNNSLQRGTTGADGIVVFENIDPGTFFVKITAQNFRELPPENITPVPFSAAAGQTSGITYYITPFSGSPGRISGSVNPAVAGILVKADDGSGNSFSTYTGPDGYYVIFNLPYATYTLSACKMNYISSVSPQVTLSQSAASAVQEILIQQITGSSLSGAVTFLAVENGIVDISILDRNTGSAINGLSTKINDSRLYNLSGIPKGEYIAWASLLNDGYVMDPDWIYKNPGGLDIAFTADTGSKSLDFSVTGAITLLSPTNPAASVIPVETDTLLPLFTWSPYSAAKEYIIEVRDLNGNLLWGGYNSDGTIRHSQISKDKTSISYNFDGSASSPLKKGEIYQWKIYADDDANPNIQTLLSSSEDLMGLFIIK